MRAEIKILILFISLFFSSCKKEKDKISPQTISLLQNKWTLISSRVVFPTNTSLNSTYTGVSTDYYQFGSDYSLTINQAGQVNIPTIPLSITTKYSLLDNNRIVYSLNPTIEIKIKTLTNNLLVLSNFATSTVTSSGVVVATYNGTKTDSLRR